MTYETSGPYVAVKRAIDESGYGMITGWPKITIKAVDAQLLLMQISLLERQAVELKARVEALERKPSRPRELITPKDPHQDLIEHAQEFGDE